MVKSKYLEKVVAIIMVAMLCLTALPQIISAAEPAAYALKGTINSLNTITDEDVPWTDQDKGSIKIQLRGDGSGAEFSAYKLLDISKNGDNRLKVSIPEGAQSFWKKYLETEGTVTIGMIKAKLNGNGFANDTERSNSIVTAFLNGGFEPITATTTTTNTGDTTATLVLDSFGFYIIQQTAAPAGGFIASAPVLACLPMQNDAGAWKSTYTVIPKDAPITITKKVSARGEDLKPETIAEIGEDLTYEIVADLPKYGSDITRGEITYKLEDKLPDAIEYNGGAVVEFYNTTSSAYEEISGCTVNFDSVDTLSVDLSTNGADYVAKFANYDKVRIRYTAKFNKSANIVIEGAGNPNTATLKYTSAVGGKTQLIESTAKVYTLRLDITKIDDTVAENPLTGATFQVYKNASEANNENNAIKFIKLTGSGTAKEYRVATEAEIAAGTNIVKNIVVSDTGEMKLYGLNHQHYYFKETVAPEGYNLPDELFDILVKPEDFVDATNHGDYNTTNEKLDFNTNPQSVKIKNDSGINLPVTGGMGTVLFTAIGLLLMAGAAYFLFGKKKGSH